MGGHTLVCLCLASALGSIVFGTPGVSLGTSNAQICIRLTGTTYKSTTTITTITTHPHIYLPTNAKSNGNGNPPTPTYTRTRSLISAMLVFVFTVQLCSQQRSFYGHLVPIVSPAVDTPCLIQCGLPSAPSNRTHVHHHTHSFFFALRHARMRFKVALRVRVSKSNFSKKELLMRVGRYHLD